MKDKKTLTQVERQFPPFYEKMIPGAIAILTILMAGMLIFSILVAIGWLS